MRPFSLNLKGQLVEYDTPIVMGIINANDNSFYADSRVSSQQEAVLRAKEMVAQGADILDIGACSTRPGSLPPTTEEEIARLKNVIPAIRQAIGSEIPISVDTYRADVATAAIEDFGADIINDISAGTLDDNMFKTVARLNVPYILMHMRGTPSTMQSMAQYTDVVVDVINEMSQAVAALEDLGVNDVIIDPGFGFAKTLSQNYDLMNNLEAFQVFRRPILVGISRKSMATRLLNIDCSETLAATTSLNTIALLGGADILRVHDVREARQCVCIYQALRNSSSI